MLAKAGLPRQAQGFFRTRMLEKSIANPPYPKKQFVCSLLNREFSVTQVAFVEFGNQN